MLKELLNEKGILLGHLTTANVMMSKCQKKKVLAELFNSSAKTVKKRAVTKHVQERNLSETRTEAGSESVARSCPSSPIALLHPLLRNHPKSTRPSELEYLPYIHVQAKEKDDYNERLTIALTEVAQKYEHPESLLLLITSKHSASS